MLQRLSPHSFTPGICFKPRTFISSHRHGPPSSSTQRLESYSDRICSTQSWEERKAATPACWVNLRAVGFAQLGPKRWRTCREVVPGQAPRASPAFSEKLLKGTRFTPFANIRTASRSGSAGTDHRSPLKWVVLQEVRF